MEKGPGPGVPARQDDRAVSQFRPFPGVEMAENGMFVHPEVLSRRRMKEMRLAWKPGAAAFPLA